jgi:hypothetical protein
MTMDWTGGCLCGDIRFRANKDPECVGHCHCRICRKQTGTAFTTGVGFEADAFKWTKGKPTYFLDSVGVARGFCGRCGSSMTWEPSGGGITVFAGSLDRAEDVQPTSHVYTSSKLPWLKIDDGLKQHSEGDPDWV